MSGKGPRPLSPEQRAALDDADYKVGFGKTPPEHRFEPGRSGNPSGRPKGRSARSILKAILDEELTFTMKGRERSAPMKEVYLHKVAAAALTGGPQERRFLLTLMAQMLPEEFQEEASKTLSPDRKQVIDRFAARLAEAKALQTGADAHGAS